MCPNDPEASGTRESVAELCPGRGGIAPARSTRSVWESSVLNTPACDAPFVNGIEAFPERGRWFEPASAGGGLTHRYGGGGANPSRRGRRAKTLRWPERLAPAAYRPTAASPSASDRRDPLMQPSTWLSPWRGSVATRPPRGRRG